MPQFRKKPVVIEAVKWDGENRDEIRTFVGDRFTTAYPEQSASKIGIHTLEGVMTARAGDWIIKGVQGEFYPCKPDIFEASYESVDA